MFLSSFARTAMTILTSTMTMIMALANNNDVVTVVEMPVISINNINQTSARNACVGTRDDIDVEHFDFIRTRLPKPTDSRIKQN